MHPVRCTWITFLRNTEGFHSSGMWHSTFWVSGSLLFKGMCHLQFQGVQGAFKRAEHIPLKKNARNHLPTGAASYLTGLESSVLPLWKPQCSQQMSSHTSCSGRFSAMLASSMLDSPRSFMFSFILMIRSRFTLPAEINTDFSARRPKS